MFVVAHEIAHIAHKDTTTSLTPTDPDGKVTISELQELQADSWALGFLKEVMADDEPAPESMALWCAFIGLFATYITEQAIYVRRNRTHPEAWERWATLEKVAAACDERTEALRAGFMCAVAGAIKLDEPFPDHLWSLLRKDRVLHIEPAVNDEVLTHWDRLHTCPLDSLIAEAQHSATREGEALLQALQVGDMPGALGKVVSSERQRARILDPALGLEFSTLRQAIDNAPCEFTTGDRALFSVAATRLAAEQLMGSHG